MSIAQVTDEPVEVVLWAPSDRLTAAGFAAQLLRRGIPVRHAAGGRHSGVAEAGDLLFVDVQGKLLVDPTPGTVALTVERRTMLSGDVPVRVPDGRSATLTVVDVTGEEHEVVAVDRGSRCVCACLVGGTLIAAAGSDRDRARRALALLVLTRGGSSSPDGLDRLRLRLLASSDRCDRGRG